MKTLALAFFAASMTVLALATAACDGSKSCNDICTTQNGCTAATMRDCTALCGNIATINSGGSCSSKYDEYRSCESSIIICSGSDVSCDSASEAWSNCAATYCGMHATDPACASGTPHL